MKKLLVLGLFLAFATASYAITIDAGDAGKVNPYVSIRGGIYFQQQTSQEGIAAVAGVSAARDNKLSQVWIDFQGNSRMGVDWTKGILAARFEIRPSSGLNAAVNGQPATVSYAWLSAQLAGGKLTFGHQDDLDQTQNYSGERLNGDNGFSGFGGTRATRNPSLTYVYGPVAVQLTPMAVFGNMYFGTTADNTSTVTNIRQQALIPKVTVQFDAKDFGVPARAGVAYATATTLYDNAARNIVDEKFTTTAYYVYAGANPQIDALGIVVTGFYAQNGELLNKVGGISPVFSAGQGTHGGNISGLRTTATRVKTLDDGLYNVNTFGAALAVNYKATDSAKVELGGGYQSSSIDSDYKPGGKDAESIDNYGIYANCIYTVIPGFAITPEVGYYSGGKGWATDKKNNILEVGAQLRVDL